MYVISEGTQDSEKINYTVESDLSPAHGLCILDQRVPFTVRLQICAHGDGLKILDVFTVFNFVHTEKVCAHNKDLSL